MAAVLFLLHITSDLARVASHVGLIKKGQCVLVDTQGEPVARAVRVLFIDITLLAIGVGVLARGKRKLWKNGITTA
ncbi:MAG: ABC-type Na+ transport system ATPase subunit NatA [Shewanella psychromarinicola]|uniref:hypothetical protein n=1 Tax=Shewanella psychromarinicola TaxID=2487742 RepID=UPI003EEFF985